MARRGRRDGTTRPPRRGARGSRVGVRVRGGATTPRCCGRSSPSRRSPGHGAWAWRRGGGGGVLVVVGVGCGAPALLLPPEARAEIAAPLSRPVRSVVVASSETAAPLLALVVPAVAEGAGVAVSSATGAVVAASALRPRLSGWVPAASAVPGTVTPTVPSIDCAVSCAAPGRVPVAAAATPPVSRAPVAAAAIAVALSEGSMRVLRVVIGAATRKAASAAASPGTGPGSVGAAAAASTTATRGSLSGSSARHRLMVNMSLG